MADWEFSRHSKPFQHPGQRCKEAPNNSSCPQVFLRNKDFSVFGLLYMSKWHFMSLKIDLFGKLLQGWRYWWTLFSVFMSGRAETFGKRCSRQMSFDIGVFQFVHWQDGCYIVQRYIKKSRMAFYNTLKVKRGSCIVFPSVAKQQTTWHNLLPAISTQENRKQWNMGTIWHQTATLWRLCQLIFTNKSTVLQYWVLWGCFWFSRDCLATICSFTICSFYFWQLRLSSPVQQ